MKKILAATLAVTLSSTAFAAHLGAANPNRNGVFKNRGQCQAALVKERNEYRRSTSTADQATFRELMNAECRRVSEVDRTDGEFGNNVVNPDIDFERDANSFVVDFLST